MTLKEKIKKGARFLDKKVPKWWRKINTSTLDIDSCEDCILGQLFGYYENGIKELNLETGKNTDGMAFNNLNPGNPQQTNFWIDEILKRRKNGGLQTKKR